MRRYSFLVALFVLAVPAFALNNRSAVSVNGSDLNPCTVASPCRSFGAAIAQTNTGGEIIALDSAGYGPFTIPGTFTVSGAPGVHAAITVTAGNGITISGTPSDRVTLRNLVIIGGGGMVGIFEQVAAEVRVLNCLIRGFSSTGVQMTVGRLALDHSTILDQNAPMGFGVWAASNGTDVIQMTIDHSLLRPELDLDFVREGVELARRYGVSSATVRPADIAFAAGLLDGSDVFVSTVIWMRPPDDRDTWATS